MLHQLYIILIPSHSQQQQADTGQMLVVDDKKQTGEHKVHFEEVAEVIKEPVIDKKTSLKKAIKEKTEGIFKGIFKKKSKKDKEKEVCIRAFTI